MLIFQTRPVSGETRWTPGESQWGAGRHALANRTMAEQRHDQTGPGQNTKYGSFETADGATVLYDRDDPTAWLESDTVVRVRD